MATFHYVGRNYQNQKVKGFVKADDLNAAVDFIEKQNIIPLQVSPAKQRFDFLQSFLPKNFQLSSSIKTQEILSFCRSIAALEEAGIPIVDAIKQLALSASSKTFAIILNEIADEIVAGKTLANTLRNYPHIFPPLFISIVEVGESTGNLSKAFLKLSAYIEMSHANKRRLISAIRYPMMVIIAIIAAISLVNVLVIPKFAMVFSSFKATLPMPTRIIIGTSNFLAQHWMFCLTSICLIVLTIIYLLKIPPIRLLWDKHKLSIPVFGELQKRITLLQFTWIFGLILRSGLPLIKGLELASNATGNMYFKQQVLLMSEDLKKGENLTKAATMSSLFPPAVLQLIAAGEKSGRVEEVLSTITDYYEREIDYDIKRVNDFIEPAILVVIGSMVLIFALGVYLPMWELVKFANV